MCILSEIWWLFSVDRLNIWAHKVQDVHVLRISENYQGYKSSPYVVYFKQHLGAVHSKCWLNYAFSHFLQKNQVFTLFWNIFLLFVPFTFLMQKNMNKAYFSLHLGCAAPKHWLKYTTRLISIRTKQARVKSLVPKYHFNEKTKKIQNLKSF